MTNANAIIIAGGQSTRMGRDKGLMEWNGIPLVKYVIEAVKPIAKNILIITGNPLYKRFGLETIPDLLSGLGPAGGIYTALHRTQTETNVIVSCDVPKLQTHTLSFLLRQHGNYEISVPKIDEHIEPLVGIYEKRCVEKWNMLIEQNELALHKMITHFHLQKINMHLCEGFNAMEFYNVNTQEAFSKLNP
ncbi:MAG: molybdenum cofactor guanylyltransferase [Chitinophagales bacterium]